jgi:hypothetical protein
MKKALLLAFVLAVFQFVFAAQSCNSTADCTEGFCQNFACTTPVPADYLKIRACNSTAQCYEGYCYRGQCIIPTASTKIFDFGVKKGCAGLFSGTLGDVDVIICDSVWLLLFILSAAAAFVTRGERNKLIPLVAFLAPVFVGVMVYPFMGVVLAVLELLFAIYRIGNNVEKKTEGTVEPPVPPAPPAK